MPQRQQRRAASLPVVVAQKATDPVPLTAAAARVVSSPQNTELAKSDKAPLDLGEAVKAAAFTSTAVAQNNTMAIASAFPAPGPTPFAACNNPDALGLS
jgi:hypothetical protein